MFPMATKLGLVRHGSVERMTHPLGTSFAASWTKAFSRSSDPYPSSNALGPRGSSSYSSMTSPFSNTSRTSAVPIMRSGRDIWRTACGRNSWCQQAVRVGRRVELLSQDLDVGLLHVVLLMRRHDCSLGPATLRVAVVRHYPVNLENQAVGATADAQCERPEVALGGRLT